jgi:hypothetical protein
MKVIIAGSCNITDYAIIETAIKKADYLDLGVICDST